MPQQLQVRELYAPSHFGNGYETAQDREMRAFLREAAFWGFNRFADWFDTIDLYDVYARPAKHYNLPEAMWDRKFANFSLAAEQGLELALVITPNHVFADQVRPGNAAVAGEKIFGQLVCPAQTGVRELILSNYRNLFADFARRGLALKGLQACPYDYGGCACDRCRPWIVTFGQLYREIVAVAREFFPGIEAGLIGWWWTGEEQGAFAAWADREAPGEFHSLDHFLPYGKVAYESLALPQGVRERAFVHVSYGEAREFRERDGWGEAGQGWREPYGSFGPSIAPQRMEATVRNLLDRRAEGFCAYSEGFFDDLNQAVLAGLSSGQYATADEVLLAYAERYLGGDPDQGRELLNQLANFETIDVRQARQTANALELSARPGWRWEQLKWRLALAEANDFIKARPEWDAPRRQAAANFHAIREHLYRQVWKLGLPRHCLKPECHAPSWQADYEARGGGGRRFGRPNEVHQEA